MPSVWVEKRKHGEGITYWVRWRTPEGGKGQEKFPNSRLAQDFKDTKREELVAGAHGLITHSKMTVADFAERHLKNPTFLEKSKSTRYIEKKAVDRFCKMFGSIPMAFIQPAQIIEFKKSLYDEGLQRNTVGISLRALRTFFSQAFEMGMVRKVPFPKKIIPGYEFTGRYLTRPEVKKLMDDLAEHHPLMYRVCLFTLYTGLRRHEVLGLDWAHVRPDGKHLVMTIQRRGRYRETTKVRRRDVLIHPAARPAMGSPQDAGQVFQWLTETVVNHQLLKATREERANLGPVRFHDLRHTWATNFMEATGDLPGLMLLGGWDSLQAVRVYQHLSKGRSESLLKLKYPGFAHSMPIPIKPARRARKSKWPVSSSETGPI